MKTRSYLVCNLLLLAVFFYNIAQDEVPGADIDDMREEALAGVVLPAEENPYGDDEFLLAEDEDGNELEAYDLTDEDGDRYIGLEAEDEDGNEVDIEEEIPSEDEDAE